jgi:hypothetical protein
VPTVPQRYPNGTSTVPQRATSTAPQSLFIEDGATSTVPQLYLNGWFAPLVQPFPQNSVISIAFRVKLASPGLSWPQRASADLNGGLNGWGAHQAGGSKGGGAQRVGVTRWPMCLADIPSSVSHQSSTALHLSSFAAGTPILSWQAVRESEMIKR